MSESGDESGDEQEPQKNHLRFTSALTEVPNGDAEAATELLLNSRGITSADSLESFKNLKKLELKDNHLSSLEFLEMSHTVCWLNLARNRIRKLRCLENLSSIVVLDLSDNKLTALDGVKGLRSLKALIAARNRISRISGISAKGNPSLETLVLSHNKIQECSLTGFEHLKKLALANNKLHAWPELSKLPNLSDLRLNGNRITRIPPLPTMLPKLSGLDVGNNLITQAQGFESLRGLLWLRDLNIRGNAAAGPTGEDPPAGVQDIIASLQRLEILNGRRLAGKSKKKRRMREFAGERLDGKMTDAESGRWHSQDSVRGDASSLPENESEDRDVVSEPSDWKKLRTTRGRGRGRGRGQIAEDDSDAGESQFLRGRGRGRGGAFVRGDFAADDLMPLRGTGQARGRGQPRRQIAALTKEHDSEPRQETVLQAPDEQVGIKNGIKKRQKTKLSAAASDTSDVAVKTGIKTKNTQQPAVAATINTEVTNPKRGIKRKKKLITKASTSGQLEGASKSKWIIKAEETNS